MQLGLILTLKLHQIQQLGIELQSGQVNSRQNSFSEDPPGCCKNQLGKKLELSWKSPLQYQSISFFLDTNLYTWNIILALTNLQMNRRGTISESSICLPIVIIHTHQCKDAMREPYKQACVSAPVMHLMTESMTPGWI